MARAKDARDNTVGAYYRVQPRISDFHAALNEARCDLLFGQDPRRLDAAQQTHRHHPVHHAEAQGGHAFAIVGYNSKGFWVQNSWGKTWGKGGLGLWQYEDWLENLMDAWVFSLALPTPQIWHLPQTKRTQSQRCRRSRPARHAARSPVISSMSTTAASTPGGATGAMPTTCAPPPGWSPAAASKYQHLLLYAHGGLNSPKDSARRIAAMKETFKANGIYPYHFMYDTGILEELKDVVVRRRTSRGTRRRHRDWTDRLLEWATRIPGRALWREMKDGARLPFLPERAGSETLAIWLTEMARKNSARLKIHICGHSTGAILLARLLETMEDLAPTLRIRAAPCWRRPPRSACSRATTIPTWSRRRTLSGWTRCRCSISTTSSSVTTRSARCTASRCCTWCRAAFEEQLPEAILGMQSHVDELLKKPKMEAVADRFAVHYARWPA